MESKQIVRRILRRFQNQNYLLITRKSHKLTATGLRSGLTIYNKTYLKILLEVVLEDLQPRLLNFFADFQVPSQKRPQDGKEITIVVVEALRQPTPLPIQPRDRGRGRASEQGARTRASHEIEGEPVSEGQS